ncbi:MAG: hypothetical protein IJ060_01945 [Oscillospiraceae bacterium]|nr:hypothetical protein [Oscillospiraceae bacterium]
MKYDRMPAGTCLLAGIGLLMLLAMRASVTLLTAGAVFLALILSFLAASWEMRLFTLRCSSARTLIHEYLPLLFQTALLIGLDSAVYVFLRGRLGGLCAVWLAAHIMELALITLLIFVIGAARTMLSR